MVTSLRSCPLQVFDSASRSPHPYSAICSGTDFWLHNQLPEIDVATAAVYPDKWLACDTDCKLEWVSGLAWLSFQVHCQE